MELELTCDTALLLRVWLFQFLLLLPTKSCALDSCSRRLGAMAEKSKKNKFSVDFKVSAVDLAKRTSVTSVTVTCRSKLEQTVQAAHTRAA